MALSSYDAIIAAINAGDVQERFFSKTTTGITLVAGSGYSLWMQGTYPAAASAGAGAAGTFTAQSRTSAGALPFTNAAGGEQLHLLMMGAQASAANGGTLLLYDRVGQVEQLSLGGTGTQAITTSIGRYTTEGCMIMGEMATGTLTTTAPQWRLSKYTDQDGNANQVSGTMTAFTGTTLTGRLAYANRFFVDLAAGDTGVRSIEEFECTVANGTAAARLQLVFAKPIAQIPLSSANIRVERDFVLASVRLPRIVDDACLAFAVLPASTTAQVFSGDLTAVSG